MLRRLIFHVDTVSLLVGFNIFLFTVMLLVEIFLLPGVGQARDLLLDLGGSLSIISTLGLGEWWRLLTANFLHADILHLGTNMLSLYFVGKAVQQIYSQRWTLSGYVITGLIGSLLFIGYNLAALYGVVPGASQVNVVTVGASRAVFGLVGILVGGAVRKNRYGVDFPVRLGNILPLVLYSLLIGFVPGLPINNLAHIGGLISGVIIGIIIPHKIGGLYSKLWEWVEKAIWVLCLGLLVICYVIMAGSIVSRLS